MNKVFKFKFRSIGLFHIQNTGFDLSPKAEEGVIVGCDHDGIIVAYIINKRKIFLSVSSLRSVKFMIYASIIPS